MKTTTILATLVIPATAAGLFAQNAVVKRYDDGVVMAQTGFAVMGVPGEAGNVRFLSQEFSFSGRPVLNAPYSADEKTESVQTLADGNRITNTTTAKVYRDSQGRTRRELTLPGFGGDAPHTLVTINDPAAGLSYTLDPQVKIVRQMSGIRTEGMANVAAVKLHAEAEAKMKAELDAKRSGATPAFVRMAPPPSTKREDLGANVIEGVSVTGTRENSTIEAGAMGNERPITIMSERWYSPDLQVEVKSVHSDPRMGETTHTLTNIVRAEPDAALFQIPSDYSKDEGKTGPPIQHFEYHTSN